MDEALIRKLRVPAGERIAVLLPPEGFLASIGLGLQEAELDRTLAAAYGYVQLFADSVATLERHAAEAIGAVKPDGLLWICYPKGTSGRKTDLNRDRGWEAVAAAGWEGVSLISIDDTWSAMRFRPVGAAGARPRPGTAERRQPASGPTAGQPDAELAPPDDLLRALAAEPEAEAVFARLAPSHRKEYIQWILEAKKPETRVSRVEKTAAKLKLGLKRPSDRA